MFQNQTNAPPIQIIAQSSPLIDSRKRGLADLLARQQDEYDRCVIKNTAKAAPPSDQLRLRAARQAARDALSSTTGDRRCGPTMWTAAAVAFSILALLKFKFG